MKTYLFEGESLTPEQIKDNLEAENCGVQELHNFIKPYTEDEQLAVQDQYIEENKELATLRKELEELSEPIKIKIKPLEKSTKKLITNINQGGEMVTEKVYCFPDYDNKMMGLYDSRGMLVSTRPMTRAEKQLHINSFKKAV